MNLKINKLNVKNYFRMLKSRLQKYSSGLKYNNMKENIAHAIERIPIGYYKNIIEGAYNRKEKYVQKNKSFVFNQIKILVGNLVSSIYATNTLLFVI